jgi:hypothetical protein
MDILWLTVQHGNTRLHLENVPERDIQCLSVELDGTEDLHLMVDTTDNAAMLNIGGLQLIFDNPTDYEQWRSQLPTEYEEFCSSCS